jgi:hypothetical protein
VRLAIACSPTRFTFALHPILPALKPNGVIYLSFKYGDTERMEEERFFNDMNEAMLRLFLGAHPELKLVQNWITEDLRNYARGYQKVLNALVRRNAI